MAKSKSRRGASPEHGGSLRDQRAALAELQSRASLLENDILPMLAQLYEPSKLEQALEGLGKPLAQRSSSELAELSSTLRARVKVSGAVLAEYESLGQPPPPDFRTWPVADLQARMDDLTSKRDELREIGRLLAQLDRQRMDWALPERSAAELTAYAAELASQLERATERKLKAELLGKIEAELWRRKEEVPVATGTLGIPELKALLKKLRTPGADDVSTEDSV